MIAFAFTFPAGRYHATPWGQNVNEANVAWPPEPARVLRALIATWWRKADHARFPKTVLDDLIDALAAEPPLFSLPDAVHSHIRTFMPAPTKPPGTLIYDAFFRLDRAAEMIVVWLGVVLSPEQHDLAAHLLERIGYLGRAESWAEGRIANDWDGAFNASPRASGVDVAHGTFPVDLVLPVTPRAWAEFQSSIATAPEKAPGEPRQRSTREGLPERLCDALAVDTSEWQKAGWSSPPPLRRLVYDRPGVGPLPNRRRATTRIRLGQPGNPEVARFVLAGRPSPRIEDTLRIAEVTRLALMSRSKDERPPVELSGRDEDGPLRNDPAHAHAFYLPEDADGDGLIDHVIVYCRLGFSDAARLCLDRLTKLWIEHGRADEEGERGRKEWRVALEDIASPFAFAQSRLLKPSTIWDSATPYLKTRFDKQRPKSFEVLIETYREQIAGEWRRRFPGVPGPSIEALLDPGTASRFAKLGPSKTARSPLAFARTRKWRGGRQPDTSGGFFRLTFEKEIAGPIALGWGAHFGLGMFSATT